MNVTQLYSKPWHPAFRQIDLKDATVKIKDGSSNEITVKIREGNLTYNKLRNMEYHKDRGVLDDVREGDEEPMDVAFDFVWEYIKGAAGTEGTPSVEDALKKINQASGWTSSDSDACRPYSVDLDIYYKPGDCTTADTENILLPDFRYEELNHDLRAGTVSCSGKCNAKQATITRRNQSSAS